MKCILYCRKSSESEDRQVMSLDAQENELTKLAEKAGATIVKVMRESKSAKAPGRPVFAEMLKLIAQGKADGILCWKLDRLARNPVDGGTISWMLQQGQIKNIKTYERDYYSNDNVLLMSVEFGMSNQYIRDLSENVKRGNREKLRRGEWPHRAPFGYYNDRNTKAVIPNPLQAYFVQRMFELYATGHKSYGDIADILYDEGLRTETGGKFRLSSVARVVENPFYCGTMLRMGNTYKGNHSPIIRKELFELVQQIREATTRPRAKTLFFPYRGLMTCAECGCLLTASRKKDKYDYYYCTNGKSICTQHKNYMDDKTVTDLFLSALDQVTFDTELIEIMYESARQRLENGTDDTQSRISDIERELARIDLRERRLAQMLASDLMREDIYIEEARRLKQEREALEQSRLSSMTKGSNRLETLELIKDVFLQPHKAISEFKNANAEKKSEIVKNLLWNLEVSNNNVAQYKFKSPYSILAKVPKNSDFAIMRRR